MLLGVSPNGHVLASYALFLWQVRKNYQLASQCFKVAVDLSPEKVYFYANFLGRYAKDETAAKEMLLQSQLYLSVQQNPPSEQSLFSLALAFHQIHCVDEAEELYRKHMALSKNVYNLSNLAELLVHSHHQYEEAEKLYLQGLEMISGAHETIVVALAALRLVLDREGALEYLHRLLNSSHIKVARNTYTEGWIIYYIHCKPEQKFEALQTIKRQLVTFAIRPKLILMFDANLLWAKRRNVPNQEWMHKLCSVYNCELEIEALDSWRDWSSIEVESPPSEVSTSDELELMFEEDQEETE